MLGDTKAKQVRTCICHRPDRPPWTPLFWLARSLSQLDRAVGDTVKIRAMTLRCLPYSLLRCIEMPVPPRRVGYAVPEYHTPPSLESICVHEQGPRS